MARINTLENIRILYAIGRAPDHEATHEDLGEHRQLQASHVGARIQLANGDLTDKLRDHKYDLIIVHISKDTDYKKLAEKCRPLSGDAYLVAEDSEYPAQLKRKQEVERYFDAYIGPDVPLPHVIRQAERTKRRKARFGVN